MQNKKLLVRTFIFVLFIVGGIWLLNYGIDKTDDLQIRQETSKNFVEEKLESLKEQEELANQSEINIQESIIKEEISHKTSESKEVLLDTESNRALINLGRKSWKNLEKVMPLCY